MKLLLNRDTQFEREGLFNVVYDSSHSRAVFCLIENGTRSFFGLQERNNGPEKAAMKGRSELVLCPIQRFSERSHLTISKKAVIAASGNGFANIVYLSIEKVRISESRHNLLSHALNIAAYNSHTKMAEFLIREGDNVNTVVEKVSYPWTGDDL